MPFDLSWYRRSIGHFDLTYAKFDAKTLSLGRSHPMMSKAQETLSRTRCLLQTLTYKDFPSCSPSSSSQCTIITALAVTSILSHTTNDGYPVRIEQTFALITTMLSDITTPVCQSRILLENHGMGGLIGDDQRNAVEQLDHNRGNKQQGVRLLPQLDCNLELQPVCASWSPPFNHWPYRATQTRKGSSCHVPEAVLANCAHFTIPLLQCQSYDAGSQPQVNGPGMVFLHYLHYEV